MKFKSVFVLFNLVVAASFGFVFAMPFLALGSEYAWGFWAGHWPVAAALAALLAGVDAFFFANRRLFALLEGEDWPGLCHYLEGRVVGKGRWSPRLVRLLANSYLVMSDPASVVALEAKAASARPSLLDKNALVFAVARILSKDHAGAASFLAARRASGKAEEPEWVDFYFGFASLLARDFESAASALEPLSRTAKDALVVALSAGFLSGSLAKALPEKADSLRSSADAARARVKAKLRDRAAWDREVERSKAEMHVVVLSKTVAEAAAELYA